MAGKGQALGTVFVELDLDRSKFEKSQQKVLEGATTTSLSVEKNWQNLNVKSDQYFTAMRNSVINSYTMISNKAGTTANEMARAHQAAAARISQINKEQYGEHVTLTDRLKKNWQDVAIAVGMAYGAFSAGKQVIDASLQMERINSTMKAVTGSASLAAKEIQFVREESARLGLNFSDAAQSYGRFMAALRGTSMEGEIGRDIFKGVSEAVTALKLDATSAGRIFLQLQQMASKGKVTAEDLNVVSESLPGARQMIAEALGKTLGEVSQMMEQGKLLASDVLPKLAEQLTKTYGTAAIEAATGGQAAINRFNNAMFDTKAALGDSLMPVFTDILNFFQKILPWFTAFVGGIKLMSVEIAGFSDKMSMLRSLAPADVLFNTKAFQDYKTAAAQIDKNVADTQRDIYDKMNPGKSSYKTADEIAREESKRAEVLRKEALAREKAASEKESKTKSHTDKISDEEKQAIKDVEDMRREIERTEKARVSLIEQIDSGIVSLSAEASMFGMTRRQTELYQLALKGATSEQYNQADAILQTIEENEKLKVVLDHQVTSFDQMSEKLMNASSLYQDGKITLQQYTKYMDVLAESMEKTKDKGKDSFSELRDAIEGWGRDSADAIVEFCMTGKNSFKDMVNSMIKDIAKMVVQQNITGPIARGISGWFGGGQQQPSGGGGGGLNLSGLGSLAGGAWDWVTGSDTGSNWGSLSDSVGTAWDWVTDLFHTGGVVGQTNVPTRTVNSSIFANAPRLHDGLASDEFPAILQAGETVIPKGGSDATDDFLKTAKQFRGIVLDGGYSYADMMGTATSDFAGSVSTATSSFSSSVSTAGTGFAHSAMSALGSTALGIVGSMVGGPVGGLVGKAIGDLLGGWVGDKIGGWFGRGGGNRATPAPYGIGRSGNQVDAYGFYSPTGKVGDLDTYYEGGGTAGMGSGGFNFGDSGNVGTSGAAFGGGYDSMGNDISGAMGDQYHYGGVPMYDRARNMLPGERLAKITNTEGVFTQGQMKAIGSKLNERSQGPSIGEIHLHIGNEEFNGAMKVIADGVVVERNKRGVIPTSRVYNA